MRRSGVVMAWNVFRFCTGLRGIGSIMILLVLAVVSVTYYAVVVSNYGPLLFGGGVMDFLNAFAVLVPFHGLVFYSAASIDRGIRLVGHSAQRRVILVQLTRSNYLQKKSKILMLLGYIRCHYHVKSKRFNIHINNPDVYKLCNALHNLKAIKHQFRGL